MDDHLSNSHIMHGMKHEESDKARFLITCM